MLAIYPTAPRSHNSEAYFAAHGTVERVNIVMDKDTGRPKGFAFVEMTEASEADKACLALSGSDLGGRALRVNEAKAKRQ